MTKTWSIWISTTASSLRLVLLPLLVLAATAAPSFLRGQVPSPPAAVAANPATAAPAKSARATPAARAPSVVSAIVSMDHLDNQRLINIGDQISLRVIEDRDPPITTIVTDSGEAEIPYIGRIRARGETCHSLALKIKELFEREYYHQATVLIALDAYGSKSRGKVYLVGQIRKPGAQELPLGETLTVSKAILAAGGMGDFADKRKVKLVRKRHAEDKDPDTVIVDVKKILEDGKSGNDPELKAEDLIIVPQRMINF